MTHRYALMIDGGFMCKRLGAKAKVAPTTGDILAECAKIKKHPSVKGLDLLRIYFYDAPPPTGNLKDPFTGADINLGQNPQHASQTRLHDSLELSPDFALRMGEVALRGWKIRPWALREIAGTGRQLTAKDIAPNLQQKGVDLRIGLDIARLSLRRLVEVIVVVTGDSDMVPAFKFARREGVRVYLHCLGHGIKRSLRAHADLVL